jgi:RNA polymerase-binding transcription factor DksA
MTNAHEAAARLAIHDARLRTIGQIESLERSVKAIIDAAELTSTDDEHDPEGATIAYERAQALALLHQARIDLEQLDIASAQLDSTGTSQCIRCGKPIPLERILAIPTTQTCVRCAS